MAIFIESNKEVQANLDLWMVYQEKNENNEVRTGIGNGK